MTTTTAATQANRTAGTIRRWCRTGVITATKVAGRWVIDAASLLRHIHPAKEATVTQIDTDREKQRIIAALRLPELTGSPKQIAWAEDLRATRIDQALTVHNTRRGVVYTLRSQWSDPLGINYINTISDRSGMYTSADEALAVLQTAVSYGRRSTARWWIDNRDAHAPMG